MPEIQRLMGSLCYTRRQSTSPYTDLNSSAQWNDMAHDFARQCCGILGQVTPACAVITANVHASTAVLIMIDTQKQQVHVPVCEHDGYVLSSGAAGMT